jgi:DNA helicase II / ATP-dependent DNA helicase PcrA
MRLEVAIYGVAANRELEYEPERGLVRYLDVANGQDRELAVPLDQQAIIEARQLVAKTARDIRDRTFNVGSTTWRRS